jgi:integrase
MSEPSDRPLDATLRQAFDRYLLPELAGRATRNTLASYECSLRCWEHHTADPPLRKIDNASLLRFRNACETAGLRPTTINSRWTHIRAILRRVGPPTDFHNPAGEGILERVPYLKRLREAHPVPRRVSFDEIDAVYAACELATWPQCTVPAAEWWRTAIALFYNLGLRRCDLFSLRTSAIDLEKRQLRMIVAKTGRALILPLNETVLAHVRGVWSEREFLFPNGPAISPFGGRLHYVQWKKLQTAAGVDFSFHDLRRTCASAFAELGGVELARIVLGHSMRDVANRFYVDPTARLAKATADLPQPASFRVPKAYVVPPAIRRTDWTFQSRAAVYRETTIRLPRRELAVLRALVCAGRPLDFEDLAAVAFWDDPAIDKRTVKGAVHRLRSSLSRALRLPELHDPLPWDRFGDRGWTLVLPPHYFAPNEAARAGLQEPPR